MKTFTIFIVVFFYGTLFPLWAGEPTVAELPAPEKAIKDTCDHWKLGFYDQVRRFQAAEKDFRAKLGTKSPEKFMTGIQHSLDKIPVNKYAFKGVYGTDIHLSAAKNEYESFQVAAIPFTGKELSSVVLKGTSLKSASGAVIPESAVTIYSVGKIRIPDSLYPEKMPDQTWHDPLLPNQPLSAKKMDLALFWVDIKVPSDAKAGDYSGDFLLEADGEKVAIRLFLHVYDFTLPDRVPFPVAVWTLNPEPKNPELHRKIFAEFLKHGIDPLDAGSGYSFKKPDDFTELDKNLEFALERGSMVFQLPGFPDKESSPHRKLYEHIKAKGWLGKALLYTNRDEATEEVWQTKNIPYGKNIRSLYPGLRIFAATELHNNMDQGCDVWLTDLSTGKGIEAAVAGKGRASLWFYFCGLPIGCDFIANANHQPNMIVESEAIEQRIVFWMAWKYGAEGIFIYAGNHAQPQRVKDDPMLWESSTSTKWPYSGYLKGDGFLMYNPAIPSIRMKILRDGLEDYGYLLELQKCLKASAGDSFVSPEVLVTTHYFNRDPQALLKQRDRIAAQIEKTRTIQK